MAATATHLTSLSAPRVRLLGTLPGWARFVALELALWGGLYAAYLAIRAVAIAGEADALRNARGLVELERGAGLFIERQAQDLVAPVHGLFSAYYMLAFGPLVAATLVWLAVRQRDAYRELSRALLVAIALASIVFVVFPAAPPRLLPELGIADTVGLAGGHDTGSFAGVRFNPYAAMPSMHVGWSLLVGLAVLATARRRVVRVAAAVHPALMTVTVVATGNHYVVDAVAGIAIALVALVLVRAWLRRGARAARPLAQGDAVAAATVAAAHRQPPAPLAGCADAPATGRDRTRARDPLQPVRLLHPHARGPGGELPQDRRLTLQRGRSATGGEAGPAHRGHTQSTPCACGCAPVTSSRAYAARRSPPPEHADTTCR